VGNIDRDGDFVVSRVFAAPRALVFAAWIEPRHLMQWWGPRGCTNRCEVDARPGGAYRIETRGSDGIVYPMKGVYREVMPPERLVYTVDFSEHPDAWHDMIDPARDRNNRRSTSECVISVTFAEEAGKTRLTVRMRFVSATMRDGFLKGGAEEGWSQSFERLDNSLLPTEGRELTHTRLFAAPRALVWRLWTEAEHIVRWWGPRGFTTTIHEMNVRPGGTWRFIMHGPDGTDYANENIYDEVVAPERLSFQHVLPPHHFFTATFTVEGDQTRVRVHMLFPTVAEREHVVKQYGADEGMVQTLDRLGELVAQTQQ
jgi:uncharacterized protein YndB with AHSA1/START domain